MPARRKQPAIDIPATRAEADALVRDYARLEHRAGEVRGFAEVQILKAKETRDAVLGVIEKDQSAIFARLKAWWEASGKDAAKGKRSIKVDGTEIGMRLDPPSLGFLNKMKAADVLKWLSGLRWAGRGRFIRIKTELDKEAIIKALSDKNAPVDVTKTLSTHCELVQKDQFYIAVAPLEKPKTEGELK
jgi:phage host-nuclease inhibitor protein Gam